MMSVVEYTTVAGSAYKGGAEWLKELLHDGEKVFTFQLLHVLILCAELEYVRVGHFRC